MLNLKRTSVTLNTQRQAIDGHVQISQSNNHVFIFLSSLKISNQSSKFNKILKDNKDACEYRINQIHHCKPNNFFFLFLNENKWFLNYSTKNNTSFITQSNKTINTPPNLKLTLSSMCKQMHVSTTDKSLNKSTREKERKHLI